METREDTAHKESRLKGKRWLLKKKAQMHQAEQRG